MNFDNSINNLDGIKNFLAMSYEEMEERNLEMKDFRKNMKSQEFFKERVLKYLTDEKKIKGINICFTDLEGKLLSLDYDKSYFVKSSHNLTFDGSSIRGFATQNKSDLLLSVDWSSFRWLPPDVFGYGKVMMFANILDQSRSQCGADFRGILQKFTTDMYNKEKYIFNIAPEIEGFLLKGVDAEQNFNVKNEFELVTNGGYYNSLPQDPLRIFIDTVAESKRAMGFENEKDHPEVAPSQFELNYKYTNALEACDQIQIYKLLCRQIAKKMGCTASFLPKPVMGINGNGMHTNISISKGNTNLFYNDRDGLSNFGKNFATAILYYAKDLCLLFNSSVNSYRRLDPKFEAPNEIRISDTDRGTMIRIPLGDENTKRIEVRSVAPDCNPYLVNFAMLKIGLMGLESNSKNFGSVLNKREKLPENIYDAIRYFKKSRIVSEILTKEIQDKYLGLKDTIASRCPKNLGTKVKACEVIYHHEVTNQLLWNSF
jgi:glutamine synthetase